MDAAQMAPTTKAGQTEEEMLLGIQGRLEDLLSRQNLSEDTFIQQHANAQMYIPLCVLGLHHYLSPLGADVGQLLIAARRSEKLAVHEDGLMVRPLLKSKRNTLILREIPEGADEEEIQNLFNSAPEKDELVAIKPDINQTMFVTFKTDEAAQTVALWLQSQKLRGERVKCAVKSENFFRSFFPAGTNTQQNYAMPQRGMLWPPAQWNFGKGQLKGGPTGPQSAGSYNQSMDYEFMGNLGWDSGLGKDGKGRSWDHLAGKGKGSRQRARSSGPLMTSIPLARGRAATKHDFGSVEQFPALSQRTEPSSTTEVTPAGAADGLFDTNGLEPKYNHEYRKYSRQALIEVCNRMEEIKKPDSYDRFEKAMGLQHENAIMFRSYPCKDWAPLPTPAASFTTAVFGEGSRRYSDEQDESAEGAFGRRRASSVEHWGRRSHSKSGDRDRDSWNAGESWMSADWSGSSRRRSKSRDRSSWDEGAFAQRAPSRSPYYGPQWVAKKTVDNEASTDAESGGARAMSWAERVKSGGGDSQPKWVPKKETFTETATSVAAASGAVEAPSRKREAELKVEPTTETKSLSSKTATPPGEERKGVPGTDGSAVSAPVTQTWAERMKQNR